MRGHGTVACLVMLVAAAGCGSSSHGNGALLASSAITPAPITSSSGLAPVGSSTGGSQPGGGGGTGGRGTGGGTGSGATLPAPAPLATPRGATGGARAEGVDVSKYQGQIDWPVVKKAGISFGITRVSDGLQYHDATFARNWAGMKQQGIVRGAYQFFRPGQDAVAQADLMVKTMGKLGDGDLAPCLDVEVTDGQSDARIQQQMATWLAEVEKKTGRTPLIYTSPGFWGVIGSPKQFARNQLWIAHWFAQSPRIPAGWQDFTCWQYSNSGRVAGINARVDLDVFHGTPRAMKAYTGGDCGNDFFRGLAPDATGKSVFTATLDGSVFSWDEAPFLGTAGGRTHPEPILGLVRTPTGKGYWLFGADGAVHAFGDALKGVAGKKRTSPIVAMAATPTGKGWWLVARDGDVVEHGDARAYGQPSAAQVGKTAVVGIAATPTGKGYRIALSDGDVLSFGDAQDLGDARGKVAKPVVAIAATPTSKGLWLACSDGVVHAFGDAPALTPKTQGKTKAPFLAMAATKTGKGLWLLAGDGTIVAAGDAADQGKWPR